MALRKDVAMALGMSQSEVTSSLERSRRAGLIDDTKRKVFKKALLEFMDVVRLGPP
jgi:DNA-binding transcriptional ArsR family regulator